MIGSSIPIGSYRSGNSLYHRLDPRVKLLGLVISSVCAIFIIRWMGLVYLGLVVIVINVCAQRSILDMLWTVRSMWLFYLITIIIHSVSNSPYDIAILPFWKVSSQGFLLGLFFSFKIALMVLSVSPLLITTHPDDWSRALMEAYRSKTGNNGLKSMLTSLGLSLRFMPLMANEATRIRLAQMGRGLVIEGGPIKRIKSLIPLISPLLTSAILKAEQTTVAMRARGFELGVNRSIYKPLKLKFGDYLFLLVFISLGFSLVI